MRDPKSPNIFQQKMNDFFNGLEFILTYIYYLLVLTKEYCTDYVQQLKYFLNKLK